MQGPRSPEHRSTAKPRRISVVLLFNAVHKGAAYDVLKKCITGACRVGTLPIMAERDRASFWVSRLREHAIAVREEWISGLLSELQASDSGTGVAAAMSDAKVFNALFTAFLFCDLNAAGAATLPPNFKVGLSSYLAAFRG